MNINRVEISGHLTQDPELKMSKGGVPLIAFCVAVNERVRNAQGEWEDYANYVDCVLFGNRADWLSRDLRKGKLVHVAGKLRYNTWEKDGERRYKLSVIAHELDYERPPREHGTTTAQAQSRPVAATPPAEDDLYDEQIPF